MLFYMSEEGQEGRNAFNEKENLIFKISTTTLVKIHHDIVIDQLPIFEWSQKANRQTPFLLMKIIFL